MRKRCLIRITLRVSEAPWGDRIHKTNIGHYLQMPVDMATTLCLFESETISPFFPSNVSLLASKQTLRLKTLSCLILLWYVSPKQEAGWRVCSGRTIRVLLCVCVQACALKYCCVKSIPSKPQVNLVQMPITYGNKGSTYSIYACKGVTSCLHQSKSDWLKFYLKNCRSVSHLIEKTTRRVKQTLVRVFCTVH